MTNNDGHSLACEIGYCLWGQTPHCEECLKAKEEKMTNNDDVIVYSRGVVFVNIEGKLDYDQKLLNLSELAERIKVSLLPPPISGQPIEKLRYCEGYNQGVQEFLSKIREAMK